MTTIKRLRRGTSRLVLVVVLGLLTGEEIDDKGRARAREAGAAAIPPDSDGASPYPLDLDGEKSDITS